MKMREYMKYLILSLILLFNNQIFSETAPKNMTVSPNLPAKVDYFANNSENIKLLKNQAYMNSSFSFMEEVAKRVCSYKIKPQSITVSFPVFSATWDTDTLCK